MERGSNVNAKKALLVVGGAGADELRGGYGNDSMVEGPWNDDSIDTFYGGPDTDHISTASMPASKDNVYCGIGTDYVQADTADIVSSDCENVDVFSPAAGDPTPQDLETPLYMPDSAPATEEAPENSQPTLEASGQENFYCNVPPSNRGSKYCGGLNSVYENEWLGVGVNSADGRCRDINFWAYNKYTYLGFAQVGECGDDFDYIYAGGKSWPGNPRASVYGKSAGMYWTGLRGYVT